MQGDAKKHLDQLREHRNPRERDLSLSFLKQQVRREHLTPAKQLGDLSQLWLELIPDQLCQATRLMALSRGTLQVHVRSSVERFELDNLLRSGVERELIRRHKGAAFRKVRLSIGPVDG